jgi:hypothetical protein
MKDTTMKGNEKGQVLVLVALAIFALLGLAALGIDVGYMYSVRHELQRSADAGALSGASSFITGDWNDTSMALDHPRGIADTRAREYAVKDTVVQTTLNPASEVAVSFPLQDRIEVITSRNADLFFARIFGIGNKLITARAVAEARVIGPNANVTCITPFAIPYPWRDDNTTNGMYDPGEHVYTTCEEGVGMCPGAAITLSVGSPSADNTSPSGQQSAGQFFLMQGNVGGETFQGANDLRNFIRDGCFSINLGLPVDLMTGNNMGPTVQAVQDVIDRANQEGFSQSFPDITDNTWIREITSPRVIRVVIYDPTYPIFGGGGGGTQGTGASVPVGYTLAGFWIDNVGRQGNNGWVTGRYIPGTAFADSTESGGTQTGTEIRVITLVE